MNEFSIYLSEGYRHIASFNGLDHLLFLLALCIRYLISDWRKVLILVTAFTIGHSITLALSVFQLLNFSAKWIEFLIPVTIVLTAISNLFVRSFDVKGRFSLIYWFALVFGSIHGLGFSNYLRSILGADSSIFWPLLAFNLGLELGQLFIVSIILFISFIFVTVIKLKRESYIDLVTGAVIVMAAKMALERIPT